MANAGHTADPARARIVQALRWNSHTIEELAELVGLTPNGVRANLSVLERDGAVERVGIRNLPGAGKPPRVYRLSARGEDDFSRAYPAALTALVEILGSTLDRASFESMLASTGRKLAGVVPGDTATALLSALGASVRTTPLADGGERVEGASCPLGAAVAREPVTCELVRSLLAGALGRDVSIHCHHGSRPRCCFEVAARAR